MIYKIMNIVLLYRWYVFSIFSIISFYLFCCVLQRDLQQWIFLNLRINRVFFFLDKIRIVQYTILILIILWLIIKNSSRSTSSLNQLNIHFFITYFLFFIFNSFYVFLFNKIFIFFKHFSICNRWCLIILVLKDIFYKFLFYLRLFYWLINFKIIILFLFTTF